MATAKDVAETVTQFRQEMMRRVYDFQEKDAVSPEVVTSFEGLSEWAASIADAVEGLSDNSEIIPVFIPVSTLFYE